MKLKLKLVAISKTKNYNRGSFATLAKLFIHMQIHILVKKYLTSISRYIIKNSTTLNHS